MNTHRFAQVGAGAGAAVLAAGLAVAPDRAWPNLLLASYALVGLGLGAMFFIALQYVCGAGWSVSFRRVPEAMTAALPLGAAGLALVFLLHPSLYAWHAVPRLSAEGLAHFKHVWLSRPFFLFRAAVYLAVWILLARAVVRTSRRQDRDGSLEHTHRNARLSAGFLAAGGLTVWLASYDWIMSLEPDWYSTIFGIYHFAGLFASALAAISVLVVRLRRRGELRDAVSPGQLHDLGLLLFGFCTFWAYIWFSQYMLIWYANIPEETAYFVRRMRGVWGTLFVLNLVLNWAVPFLALLPRRHKRAPEILGRVAAVVLVGRWLDLYLMILPGSGQDRPWPGIWEAAAAAATVGGFLLVFQGAYRKAPPIPLRDPLLEESLHQ